MHVLLHPVGSHGDVHPLVAVGRGLVARGHRVTLVTAAPFRDVAAACGFAFAPVGTDADYDAVINNPDLWHPRRGLRTIFAPDRYARSLREAYHHLADRYVPGDTVAVAGDLGFPAARLAQEKLGLPVVSSHIAPVAFQSVADPPTVWLGRPPDWLPHWVRRWAYRMGGRFVVDPVFKSTVNAFRRELGLPPLARLWGVWNDSPQRIIGLFPRWFADAPDWPAHLECPGFVRYDRDEAGLPPAVEAFLAAGPPPVVVSFGSAMRTGRPHFEAAVAAVRQIGHRGLVLAKGGEQIPPLPADFLHADYAPFGRVFPRAAAVVHHGGIGTTAQGLAAGVPHLVMPMAFDQHDNAARLLRLGVARVVPAKRFTADAAAASLRELLGSAAVLVACAEARARLLPIRLRRRLPLRLALTAPRRVWHNPGQTATAHPGRPLMATDTARPRHLWQLPTFAAGLAAAVAAVAAFPPPPPDPSRAFTAAVAELQQAVEKKPAALADAERLLPEVAAQAETYPELAAKVRLLLGTADLLLAEATPADADRWASAAAHFAKVDTAKLDEDDTRRLAYRRAKCDAALGRGDAKALAAVLVAPPTGEAMDGERLRLLGDCYLRQTPPDLKKATPVLKDYLGGAVKLPAAEVARYKLQLADALLGTGEPDKAKPWLNDLAKAAPAEVQTRARFLLAGLAAADNDWAEAVAKYEEALQGRTLPADQAAAARYQLGVGLTKTGRPTLAVPAFEAAAEAGGPTAVAARVRLAELAVADPAGRGNRKAALDRLDTLTQALAAAPGELPKEVTRPQVQAVFEEAIQVCLNEADFAAAVRACTLAAGVLPPGRDRVRRAEANVLWAATLGQSPDAAAKLKEAAADYAALAADPGRADRGQLLRQAAELYRKAGDAAAAVALTDQLTAAPGVPADVAGAAWLDKGEALLAAGKFADAAEALKKAMATPTPAAGVARVKLGLAHLQQAKAAARIAPPGSSAAAEAATEFDLGQQLLAQSAASPADSPAAREAQQLALFELGKVLLSRQNLSEAEARFRQLVQTYPGGPQSGPGQLYLGSCLLLLARGDGAGGRAPADADAKLAEAVKLFEGLTNTGDDYLKREGAIRLVNAVLLQQKYDEVPGLCDRLAQPYRGKVQELILLSMAYKAHEYARRPEKATATRVLMEELYARLTDADFPGGTAEYTRAYWVGQWFEPLRKAAQRGTR